MGLFRSFLEARMKWDSTPSRFEDLPAGRLGVEIEFLLPIYEPIEEVDVTGPFIEDMGKRFPGWKYKIDVSAGEGSLGHSGRMFQTNNEIVSPILPLDASEELESIGSFLEEYDAHLSEECGIHFHISLWDESADPPVWFVLNLISLMDEPGIVNYFDTRFTSLETQQYVKRVRSRLAQLVRRYGEKVLDLPLRSLRTYLGGDDIRELGVNLQALDLHGTIEFRYFGKRTPGRFETEDLLRPYRYLISLVKKASSTKYRFGKKGYGGDHEELKRDVSDKYFDLTKDQLLEKIDSKDKELLSVIRRPRGWNRSLLYEKVLSLLPEDPPSPWIGSLLSGVKHLERGIFENNRKKLAHLYLSNPGTLSELRSLYMSDRGFYAESILSYLLESKLPPNLKRELAGSLVKWYLHRGLVKYIVDNITPGSIPHEDIKNIFFYVRPRHVGPPYVEKVARWLKPYEVEMPLLVADWEEAARGN